MPEMALEVKQGKARVPQITKAEEAVLGKDCALGPRRMVGEEGGKEVVILTLQSRISLLFLIFSSSLSIIVSRTTAPHNPHGHNRCYLPLL